MKTEDKTGRLKEIAAGDAVRALHDILGPEAKLCLVGGTVRDVFLERPGSDLDLASALPPFQLVHKLQEARIRVVPTGLKHQTVTAVLHGASVEITSFRGAAMRPAGGAVLSGDIETDLKYRDFTINAMAFDIEAARLFDPHGGAADIAARLIRAAGEPRERFAEDPLRVLRMLRFSAELAFEIEPSTLSAAKEFAQHLVQVSPERVREELIRILMSDEPDRAFLLIQELGFLPAVLPELIPSVGCEQNRFHSADVFRHTLEVVRRAPKQLVIRLAALLHDVAKPHTVSVDPVTGDRHFFKHESVGADIAAEALRRLRFSNEIIDSVSSLVRLHMRPFEAGSSGIRRLMRDAGPLFDEWLQLKIADTGACKVLPEDLQEQLRRFDEQLAIVRAGPPVSPLASLAVKGQDLLAAGLSEGPLVGQVLRSLHERVLDDPDLNEKEKLLALLPQILQTLRT